MSTSPRASEPEFVATKVWFTDEHLCVELSDGREIRVPLAFYPSLAGATKTQRETFKLIGLGTGIHWPDIDEDLSVKGIVLGWK